MSFSRPAALVTDSRKLRALMLPVFLFALISFSYSQDVLTYHNNNARTGLNNAETILTPANVSSTTFGKVMNIPVDGHVDAQPLYLSGVTAGGVKRNLLIVATEADSVYAFDADTGVRVWHDSLLKAGEIVADSVGCGVNAPKIGVQATPVIYRPKTGDPIIYAVAMSKDAGANYHQRLHAIDAVTGAEVFGQATEIQASFPGSGDNTSGANVIFDPSQYRERASLLLVGRTVY